MTTIRRLVQTGFWTEPEALERYSVEDKYFMLYLMTNPATTQLGIYRLSKRLMSFECGYSVEMITELLDRFENDYQMLVYSEQTQELTLKYSLTYTIIKGGKPVTDCLAKELTQVKDVKLILETYHAMLDYWLKSNRNYDQIVKQLFEIELAKRSTRLKLNDNEMKNNMNNVNDIDNDMINGNVVDNVFENEMINANEGVNGKDNVMRMINENVYDIENENEYENDNEESYPESPNESYPNSSILKQYVETQFKKVEAYYQEQIGSLTHSEVLLIKSWLSYLSVEKVIEVLEDGKGQASPIRYARAFIDLEYPRVKLEDAS